MNETQADITRLQAILDASAATSGAHLRSAFDQEKRASAHELVGSLTGIIEVHLGVLAGHGAPLVAPVDAIFFKARLWVGLPAASLRSKLLRSDDRVSASFVREDISFIVHGTFVRVDDAGSRDFRVAARGLYVAAYGDWMGDYIDSKAGSPDRDLTGFIEPRVMFAKRS